MTDFISENFSPFIQGGSLSLRPLLTWELPLTSPPSHRGANTSILPGGTAAYPILPVLTVEHSLSYLYCSQALGPKVPLTM